MRIVAVLLASKVAPAVVVAVIVVLFTKKLFIEAQASSSVPSTLKFTAHPPCRLAADYREELCCYFMLKQSLPTSAGRAGIEGLLQHVHVEKPTKQEIVLELLTELPFASDRIERNQQQALQEPLGWYGRSAHLRIHRVEHW